MSGLVTRFFSFDELTPGQGWDLLRWCRDHGAEEFTLTGLIVGDPSDESERMKRFFAKLEPHRLPDAARRRLHGHPLVRAVERWRLTRITEGLLQEGFPDGYVSYKDDRELWLKEVV